jgi:3-keto-5-aminohexanoate cleavage enzyme
MPYEGFEDYFEKKVILSVATTGGLHGKKANPNLPTQPDEVAKDLQACEEAGASMVHLHARDENHEDTKDVERFQLLLDAIDDYCDDIIVNFTTGGGGIYSREERIAPVLETDPGPEVATIDVGPMNFGQTRTAINPREMSEEYAERMREAGVKPELEIFNQGHIPEMENLIEKDLLDAPYWASVILGMQTGTPPHPRNLINLVDNLPPNTEWQALAVGRYQLPLTTMAMTMGGHVRVGMEDNVYYRKGELAESNAQLVRRTARIADELERPIASPAETRELLGL